MYENVIYITTYTHIILHASYLFATRHLQRERGFGKGKANVDPREVKRCGREIGRGWNVGVGAINVGECLNNIFYNCYHVNFIRIRKKNGIRNIVWIFDGCAFIEYGLEAV